MGVLRPFMAMNRLHERAVFFRVPRDTHTNTHFDSAMFGPNDFASLFGARILFGRMQSHDRGKMQ